MERKIGKGNLMTKQAGREAVSEHYAQPNLSEAILAALKADGKDPASLTVDDLFAVDEFHIAGREATELLAQKAGLETGDEVLDVGSGIGGPARTLAANFGCRVQGVDLTEEYCRVAQMLTDRVGLNGQVTFRQGNALELPFEDESFDCVWTQHATMNIAEKERLYAEMHRVLRPQGKLVFYDIFEGNGEPVHIPVPWAGTPEISFLRTPEKIRALLQESGFREKIWEDVTERCREWFRRRMAQTASGAPQPNLGLQILLGKQAKPALGNVLRSLEEGRLAVVQGVLERA